MIHPAPTTQIPPTLARGVLAEVVAPTATTKGHIVIEFPNSNYHLHLVPVDGEKPLPAIGKRIVGTIHAQARRVDVVDTGGKYVEPVAGRPRRVQGRVVDIDAKHRTITVDAGMAIHLRLTDGRQKAEQFSIGDLVSTDVLDGATFTAE